MSCSTASVKSASRNAVSRSARAFTVSLKSRVNAIGSLLIRCRASATGLRCPLSFFAPLVVGPSLLRCRDVLLLAALGTSRQQNHEPVAVPAEVDPVSWPEIDPEFLDPCPDALHIGNVTKPNARQRDRDLRGGQRSEHDDIHKIQPHQSLVSAQGSASRRLN